MNDWPRELSSTPELTAYERRLWVEVDRILYQNYLSPRTVTDFWQGDRAAVVSHLKKMKLRAIRAVVIMEYVEVDDVLNQTIRMQFFGKGRHRKGKKYAAVQRMLERIYLQQKLDIVRGFKEVPRDISNHIMALNDIRNILAHRFDLRVLPKTKRLYRSKYE